MDSKVLKYIENEIKELLAERYGCRTIIAIDGTAASGKTTLAADLSGRFDCNVFHMDDYFLCPSMRTPERLAEIGGNVDYERFRAEIIEPILQNQAFSYAPYNCHTQSLMPKISVVPKQLNIIEGVYSRHPYFADVIDLAVVLDIDECTQREKIAERNPDNYQKFFDIWIPLEKRYLNSLL